VRLGFLLKGSLLDVNQGVYIERILRYCKAVLQVVQFVDLHRERRFDTGSSCADNTGKLSGTYTAGASMLACATPCSSGSVVISPEVMVHRVTLWIKPAPESVRVCVPICCLLGTL
jgi:hypothetical protein